MENYSDGDLRIESVVAKEAIQLLWRGKSNARDPGATLLPFFDRVGAAARERNASIEIRLNELDYFNSSTLAAIIRGIRQFRQQGTRVLISYRESSGWQRRSCEALRILESDGVVEIKHD